MFVNRTANISSHSAWLENYASVLAVRDQFIGMLSLSERYDL